MDKGYKDYNDYVRDCKTFVKVAHPKLSDHEVETNYLFYMREGGIRPPRESDYCFECGS